MFWRLQVATCSRLCNGWLRFCELHAQCAGRALALAGRNLAAIDHWERASRRDAKCAARWLGRPDFWRLEAEAVMSEPGARQIGQFLADAELFRNWPAGAIAQLSARTRQSALVAGQRLFSKGESGSCAFLVLEGHIRITTPSADGRERLLALIGPGEVVGEIAMLDGGERTASATANTACRVLSIERRDMLTVVDRFPGTALSLLGLLCARLRRTTRQVEEISFLGLPARLARALLRHAAAQGAELQDHAVIAVTQRQLGEAIGLSREGTNRILRAWCRQGYVSLDKGLITVRDVAFLSRLASGDTAVP